MYTNYQKKLLKLWFQRLKEIRLTGNVKITSGGDNPRIGKYFESTHTKYSTEQMRTYCYNIINRIKLEDYDKD